MELAGMEAAVYLRKSRAEDGLTTAETLSRHQATLTEYAARRKIRNYSAIHFVSNWCFKPQYIVSKCL